MHSNFYYFEISQNCPDKTNENPIDVSGAKGIMVIAQDKNFVPFPLQQANHKLTELIISYKTLRNKTDKNSETVKENILQDIIALVENTAHINYSAFCVYFQVLKYSYATYKDTKNKLSVSQKSKLFKEIINCYIDNRHNTYMSYGYSDQVLQVMSDAASSRRNSKTGIEKIEMYLSPYNVPRVKTLNDINTVDVCYILPDKGDKKLFDDFLNQQNIHFVFRKSRDNKYPDMLIKKNKFIWIIEHKLTNGDGGAQNAEINEIISFIKQQESNKNVSYISCLEGNFMQRLSENSTQPKNQHQLQNILSGLRKNHRNYFVNGVALGLLIQDFMTD